MIFIFYDDFYFLWWFLIIWFSDDLFYIFYDFYDFYLLCWRLLMILLTDDISKKLMIIVDEKLMINKFYKVD
jgi:hypothetical protein